MKMNRKDKKITIVKTVTGQDEDGFEDDDKEIIVYKDIWAYYRHISGKEFYAARSTNTKVEVIFIINYRKDIDETMQIIYKDKKYYITQIDDFEDKKTDLKIYAYRLN